MRLPKILSAMAAALILFATNAIASAEQQMTDYADGVNWQGRVITVTGIGLAPPNAVNRTQAKGLASQAARADAYRKLAEIVNGVRVEGETTIEKMLTTRDQIQLKVSATIKGAKVTNETFMSDGSYRVTMQVPLFGVSNSLASAVLEKPATVEPFPNPVLEIEPSPIPYTSTTPIRQRLDASRVNPNGNFTPSPPVTPTTPYKPPLSRMSVPSLDTIILQKLQAGSLTVREPIYQQPAQNSQIAYDSPPRQTVVRRSVEEYASLAQGDYTGLIVDCRGLYLQPVMSPVIKNTNGTKIYGHKNLDYDRIISEGMVDYIGDTEHVDRAGANPLVVKAVAVDNFNSNPVLAISDSNRVLIENHATKFLKDLKVVFFY